MPALEEKRRANKLMPTQKLWLSQLKAVFEYIALRKDTCCFLFSVKASRFGILVCMCSNWDKKESNWDKKEC